jgi:hypothetical protein
MVATLDGMAGILGWNGTWTLGPDQKERKRIGWWVDAPNGASVKFAVKLTAHPMLSISYLTSYAHMGRAHIRVNGKLLVQDDGVSPKILNAQRTDKFSLVETTTLCLHVSAKSTRTFDSCDHWKPEGMGSSSQVGSKISVVEVQLLPDPSPNGNKFKVTGISTC